MFQIIELNPGVSLFVHAPTKAHNPEVIAPAKVLRLDSKVYFFTDPISQRGADSLTIKINETYRVGRSDKLKPINSKFGAWSDINGLKVDVPLMWERRYDLTGLTIRAASVDSPPQNIVTKKLPNGQILLDGMMFEIFDNIRSTLNFS